MPHQNQNTRKPSRQRNRRRRHHLLFKSCLILLLTFTTRIANTNARVNYYGTSTPPFSVNTAGTIALATCLLTASCIKIVSTGNECLVERLGKYKRRLGPGLHLIIRPLERISFEVSTQEQVMDVPPQQCYTRDNAPIKADAVVFMRIIDSAKARYEVDNHRLAILNLCLTQIREEVGKLTLDESFSSRDVINKSLLTVLNAVCDGWGVQITRVEIQSLEPSRDILVAMELQMAAERKKRASVLKSEGERITLVNQAEGNAKALLEDARAKSASIIMEAKAMAERMTLEAAAVKSSIETIAMAMEHSSSSSSSALVVSGKNAVSRQNVSAINAKDAVDAALQFLLFSKYMETQAKFANAAGTKVLMFPTKDRYEIYVCLFPPSLCVFVRL
mmetsp:Transcript_45197/g.68151  ORF Transcript_45197/g.68151 Transcript_45197/m.68151 type:complete len:390 (-) Transcript_45197:467-1636(-)